MGDSIEVNGVGPGVGLWTLGIWVMTVRCWGVVHGGVWVDPGCVGVVPWVSGMWLGTVGVCSIIVKASGKRYFPQNC